MKNTDQRLAWLRKAETANAAVRFDDVVTALGGAWKLAPHPSLVPLISTFLDRAGVAGVAAARERDTEQQWHTLARRRTAANLQTMAVTRWPRLPSAAKARVQALVAGKPDVIATVALWRLITTDPYESSIGDWCLRTALRALFSWKDPTAPVLLAHTLKQHRYGGNAGFGDLQRRRAAPPVEFSEAERAIVDTLSEATSRQPAANLEQLLAAVLAEPGNLASRAVYADALTEIGDPRGEFISLQLQAEQQTLNPEQKRRERALVQEHGKKWLGELAPFVDRKMASAARAFRAGFPAELEVTDGEAFARSTQWATVERIVVGHRASFRYHPNLRALKSVHGVSATSLAGQHLPALEHLALHEEVSDLVNAAPTLVGVAHLEFLYVEESPPSVVATFLRSQPWVESVRQFTTWALPRDLAALPTVWQALPKLERCSVTLHDQAVEHVRFERSGQVTLIVSPSGVDLEQSVREIVTHASLTRAASVQLVGSTSRGGASQMNTLLAAVQAQLARLGVTTSRSAGT